jgi:hypothetical protein
MNAPERPKCLVVIATRIGFRQFAGLSVLVNLCSLKARDKLLYCRVIYSTHLGESL